MPKSAPPENPSLREIQRTMLDAIRKPLRPDQTMQPANRTVAERIIAPNEKLTAVERLEVYSQQYWWRLEGLFGDDFPGVRAVVGPRRFDKLTITYLSECPSRSWTLRNLGSRFAQFLADHPQLAGPHAALAQEVASVEWASTVAFDDPELTPIAREKLATADPATLRLRLQPHLQLVQLRYPVDDLLAKLRAKTSETSTASNATTERRARRPARIAAEPLAEPRYLAIHRSEHVVYYKHLGLVAWRLLTALREKETLEAACEAAFENVEMSAAESVIRVRDAFALFTKLGWLCR